MVLVELRCGYSRQCALSLAFHFFQCCFGRYSISEVTFDSIKIHVMSPTPLVVTKMTLCVSVYVCWIWPCCCNIKRCFLCPTGYRINSNRRKRKIGQVNAASLLLSEPTETMRQGSLSSVSDCKCEEMGVRFRLSWPALMETSLWRAEKQNSTSSQTHHNSCSSFYCVGIGTLR